MNDIALGITHITDWQGYDHMLYLLALVARYDLRHAGKAALLATAFTVGHSLTLAVASLDLFRVPGKWVEFLIPVTILITALWSLRSGEGSAQTRRRTYIMAACFGLIHGLGFSSFFRINVGDGEGMLFKLLKFNLGVELGQILILLIALSIFSLARAFGVTPRTQQIFIGGLALGLSTLMTIENWPL